MQLAITAFYSGLLALCYLYLTSLVIKGRIKGQVSLGDGGDTHLNRFIRAHSNFSEYVPLALVLLACLEINDVYTTFLHICALLLVFGRLLHAYGLCQHSGASWQRSYGMIMTLVSLSLLAVSNLSYLYWA